MARKPTYLSVQRYNARMSKLWEKARAIECKRVDVGELPNPNLTDIESLSLEQLRKIVGRAAGYRKYTQSE